MADNKWVWVALGLFLLWNMGYLNLGNAPAQATTTSTTVASGGGLLIDHVTEDTTVTLTGVDAFALGTSISAEFARVFISNNDIAQATDQGQVSMSSGTYTATPNDLVTHYYYENSSTYYTVKESFSIPDKGTVRKQGLAYNMDTAPTLQFYNSDGDSANTAQTISSGQTKTLKIRYTPSNDNCVGNPKAPAEGNYVAHCFEYNDTEFKAPKLVGQSSISLPSTFPKNASTEYSTVCYKGDSVCDNVEKEYSLEVTAQNKDPTADMVWWIEDQDYDINAQTRAEIYGFVDEDQNDLGAAANVRPIVFS